MVEQSQLLNEIKKLEASARQYQQEVSVLTTLQTHTNLTTNHWLYKTEQVRRGDRYPWGTAESEKGALRN
jgi:hypothetical protein